MYNPFSLEKKTILVTGASSGIGRATAIECSKMGASLIITGRNEERLNKTYDELQGSNHKKIACDLSFEENIKELAKQMPNLDGIVHSAGTFGSFAPFQFVSSQKLKTMFDINFFAPVLLSQTLVKEKKIQNNSSIVFISSVSGTGLSRVATSIYAASKSAVAAMAKGMALDLAPKKIRVNCVLPGAVETPMTFGDTLSREQYDIDIKSYPLKRYGKPEEIAYAVIYLLSDASSWVTGSNLVIDGGITLL